MEKQIILLLIILFCVYLIVDEIAGKKYLTRYTFKMAGGK